MKTKLYILVLIFTSSIAVSQNIDTVFKSVMAIPFNPKMYISDADRDIAKYSDMSHENIRERFRLGLDVNLHVQILTNYNSISLLKDTSSTAFEDLQRVYHSLEYKYAVPQRIILAEEKENKKTKNRIKKFFKKEKEIKPEIEHGLFEDYTTKEIRKHDEEKFLHAEIRDTTLLPYLYNIYQTELFLFINQFDIITDFKSCIDLQNGIYERVMKVHFSVYDKDNTMIDGDYVEVRFPSNENNLISIMREHIPVVAKYCINKLPYYKEVEK